MANHNFINQISSDTPILIAGQTASGKSQLALQLAEKRDRVIVNADAIQVYENWRILTARPSIADEALTPHMLYGHIAAQIEYSVGNWLKDIQKILPIYPNPIIVGGTGLYFSSLTNGLIDIPNIPAQIRLEAKNRIESEGFESLIEEIDPETSKKIEMSDIECFNHLKKEQRRHSLRQHSLLKTLTLPSGFTVTSAIAPFMIT